MATKYFGATGSDTTGDGSFTTPWATLAYALTGSRVAKGDTLVALSNFVFPSAATTIALAAGDGGAVYVDFGGFVAHTSGAVSHCLVPPTSSHIKLGKGTIYIDHAISLGLFRFLNTAHLELTDGLTLYGQGYLEAIIFDNSNIQTTLTLDGGYRFNKPGRLINANNKAGGGLTINLGRGVLKDCFKVWASSNTHTLDVNSTGRTVFHGCADTGAFYKCPIYFPSTVAVPDKSGWDVDISGHVFIQGDGTGTKNFTFVKIEDALAGRGSYTDVFEDKFKNNIIYNYGLDSFATNASAAQFYDELIKTFNDIIDVDASNVWRPPFPSEPVEWADYEVVQEWARPAPVTAALVGDSIAWGTGTTDALAGSAYQMGVFLSPISCVAKAETGLPGVGIEGIRWWADRVMCKFPAKYVAVLVGINNAKSGGEFASLTDQQLADHAAHVLSVIEARGATPIWIGLGPDVGESITRANAINAAMQIHCAANGWGYLPWIDEMVKSASWQTAYFANISTDLHPNDAGALLIGEVAERAVRQLNDGIVWGMRTPFDTTMPTLTLSPDCPGKLKQVQEWRKVVSAKEIGKY